MLVNKDKKRRQSNDPRFIFLVKRMNDSNHRHANKRERSLTLGWILYRLITRPHRLIPTLLGYVPRSIMRSLFQMLPVRLIWRFRPEAVINDPYVCQKALATGGTDFLAAILMRLVDDAGWQSDRPTIFCSSRVLFEKDLVELRRLTNRFNWVILHSDYIARCQILWLPEELREQRNYFKRIGLQHAEAMAKGDALADELMAQFKKRWGLAAIAAANIDYWEEELYRRYSRRSDVPFLTLSQEHVTIPYYYSFNIRELQAAQFVYDGAGVAVFGPLMRDMMVESGACRTDQVWVTGAPRLDAWQRPEAKQEVQDTITLITFTEPEYFGPKNFAETLRCFCATAAKHRDENVRFVVKCKTLGDQLLVETMAGEVDGCEFDHKVPLFELMARSRLIINFNSLAMLEALLSPARLAVPNWGDTACASEYQQLSAQDPVNRSIYDFPESAQELEALIDQAVTNWNPSDNTEERIACLSRYFHWSPEASASAETERYAAHFIEQANDAQPDRL